MKQQDPKKIWTDPQSFTSTLTVLLLDTFGDDALTWDPETIQYELRDEVGVTLPPGNFARLMLGRQLLTTDGFWRNLRDFITACNIMSGSLPGDFDPADADEMAWGITEALILAPPDDLDHAFSPEILAYIGHVTAAEGLRIPPDVLRIGTTSPTFPTEFTDDPIMFQATYTVWQERADEINKTVRDGYQRLARQLQALPLKRGTVKNALPQLAVERR